MATKKIADLTQVNSLNDNDLLLVQTEDGTRAVAKNVIISNDERERIAETGYVAQAEPPENKLLLWLDTSDTTSEIKASIGRTNVVLKASNWIEDQTYDDVYTQVVTAIQGSVFADISSISCFEDIPTRKVLKANGVEEIRIENRNGTPVACLIGKLLSEDITIQVEIITI